LSCKCFAMLLCCMEGPERRASFALGSSCLYLAVFIVFVVCCVVVCSVWCVVVVRVCVVLLRPSDVLLCLLLCSVGEQEKHMAMMRLHRYEYFDIASRDPHLYAVLLKEWLKRLPQPLLSDYEVWVVLLFHLSSCAGPK
jgi:hypothetical protein